MLAENPLYIALKRIQTRPLRIFSMVAAEFVFIGIISFICLLGNTESPSSLRIISPEKFGGTFAIWMIVLQYISLVIYGTFSIESRVVRDRISEIINFHRLTRLTPASIITGYMAGASSDAIILWIIVFFSGMTGVILKGITFSQYLASSLLILLCAAFFYLFAVWSGLNKPIYLQSGARQVWGIASMLSVFCALPTPFVLDLCFFSSTPSILSIFHQKQFSGHFEVAFFGMDIPPVIYSLSLWICFGTILWFSSIRKVFTEDSPRLSKKETLWILGIIAFFITGRTAGMLEKFTHPMILGAGIFSILFFSATTLVMAIPQRINLRRYLIKLQTKKTVPWHHDDMTALTLTEYMVMLSVIALAIIYMYASVFIEFNPQHYFYIIVHIILFSLTMFFILFVVEGCRMRFEKNQDGISALVIFTWLIAIPIISGIYLSQGSTHKYWILGLSPTNFFLNTIPQLTKHFELSSQIYSEIIMAIVITTVFTCISFLFWRNSRKIFEDIISRTKEIQ